MSHFRCRAGRRLILETLENRTVMSASLGGANLAFAGLETAEVTREVAVIRPVEATADLATPVRPFAAELAANVVKHPVRNATIANLTVADEAVIIGPKAVDTVNLIDRIKETSAVDVAPVERIKQLIGDRRTVEAPKLPMPQADVLHDAMAPFMAARVDPAPASPTRLATQEPIDAEHARVVLDGLMACADEGEVPAGGGEGLVLTQASPSTSDTTTSRSLAGAELAAAGVTLDFRNLDAALHQIEAGVEYVVDAATAVMKSPAKMSWLSAAFLGLVGMEWTRRQAATRRRLAVAGNWAGDPTLTWVPGMPGSFSVEDA